MFGRINRGRRKTAGGRIFVTLQRGERIHCLGLPPALFWTVAALVPGAFTIAALTSTALLYRDDLVSGLVNHERALVQSYEQKIAEDRAQFDAANDRVQRERAALDERLRSLAARQANLEARTARVAALGSKLGGGDVTGSITSVARGEAVADPAANAPGALSRLLRFGRPSAAAASAPLPAGTSTYAPAIGAPGIGTPGIGTPATAPRPSAPAKPQPATLDMTSSDDAQTMRPDRRSSVAPEDLGRSLDHLESTQAATVTALLANARQRVGTYETAFARLGLDANRLRLPEKATNGQGGPLVPVQVSTDDPDIATLATQVERAERLARLASHVPLAAPAEGTLEMTSPFGVRRDPFTGGTAMHTGLDLRQEPGAPIYATAAGRVTVAENADGYGNMVEIDHGNGLRTRYGHLSSIGVHEDQWVDAGAIVGRAGSTGRSTGTHLHYEVRVEGEPVDPTRFLETGAKLAEAKL